ncbi:MAG: hypothetical protein Q4A01_01025 [Coriobacteriales bacterium]|nr:hypothetical protein [Coriobacteriales bacterium]
MKKRIVATVLCTLGLCGLLVGCGAPAPQPTASDAPKTETQTQTDDKNTKESKTEQPAPAEELPKNSVLVYFDDEGYKRLVEDMAAGKVPKKCEALFDQMGGLPSVAVTDEDQIKQMYDYVSNIRVLDASGMSITDSYHYVYFELQDGTKVGLRFEGAGNLVRPDTNYAVEGDAVLWAKVRELQGATTGDDHVHPIVVADEDDLVESCPTSAMAGEVVRVSTKAVLDVQTVVTVNGQRLTNSHGLTWEFVMPDVPVEVRVFTEEYPFGGGS